MKSTNIAARRLLVLGFPALLNLFCGGLDRGRSTLTVSGSGGYAQARTKRTLSGCEDPDHDLLQKEDQYGGAVKLRYEARTGWNAEVEGGAVHARIYERTEHWDSALKASEHGEEYALGVFGAALGYDWKHFGFSHGFQVVTGDVSGRHQTYGLDARIVPRMSFRAGRLDLAWAEWGLFPAEGALDGRTAFVGAGYVNPDLGLRMRGGLVLLGRTMLDLGAHSLINAGDGMEVAQGRDRENPGVGVYLGGELLLQDRWLLGVNVVGARLPGVQLTLGYRFGWGVDG